MCGYRRSATAHGVHIGAEGQVATALPASNGQVLYPGAAQYCLFGDRIVQ